MSSQKEKSDRFAALHAQPRCFLVPNPWDTGSARLLEWMGFEALATTSAGFAFSHGRPDMGVTREQKMSHLHELCAATSLPVSADLQNGFGDRPEDAAETIRLAAQAGAVGGSIEDARGDDADPICDIGLARERIAAAAEAAARLPFKFMLTARAENHLYGRNDLADTIRRLQAYEAAGADVLFAPGLRTLEEIRAVLQAVRRPLNVIMGMPGLDFGLQELQDLGVRRVSVGGSLARAAYGALIDAAHELKEKGSFRYAEHIPSTARLNEIFRR
jgi:2-methylisocitrate lyase-like PEP mutase family enzyme